MNAFDRTRPTDIDLLNSVLNDDEFLKSIEDQLGKLVQPIIVGDNMIHFCGEKDSKVIFIDETLARLRNQIH